MKKILIKGAIVGLIMGIALFITGIFAAHLTYGPSMVPEGKFEPDQINAVYFLWTKLVIGLFFGIIFTGLYSIFYHSLKFPGIIKGIVRGIAIYNYNIMGYLAPSVIQ